MVKAEFITGRGLEFNLITLTMSLKLYIKEPKVEMGILKSEFWGRHWKLPSYLGDFILESFLDISRDSLSQTWETLARVFFCEAVRLFRFSAKSGPFGDYGIPISS